MRALKWFEARERWNLPRHQSIPDNFQARKPRRNETPEDQPMNFNQSSPSITASTPNVCLHLAIRTPAYVNEGRKRIRAAEIQSPPPPLFFWSLFLSACVKIGFNVFRLSLFSYLLVEFFISRLLLFLSHVRTGDSVWWSAWPLQLLHIPHNWTLNSSVHSPQTKEPVEARDPLNVSNPFSSFLWILLTSFYSFLGMCVYQPQPRAHSSVDKWARRKWEKWSPNSSCQCANWLFTDCGPGNSAGFRMVAAW